MHREIPALVSGVIVQAAHAGVNQPDHILGSGRLGASGILGIIQLPYEFLAWPAGQNTVPQPQGYVSGAARHSRAVHEPPVWLETDHDHGTGRRRVPRGNERLIDPRSEEHTSE